MTKDEIAQIRRWFGYSQKTMGAKIGAALTTVSDMERGRRDPTDMQLKRLTALKERMIRDMRAKVAAQ